MGIVKRFDNFTHNITYSTLQNSTFSSKVLLKRNNTKNVTSKEKIKIRPIHATASTEGSVGVVKANNSQYDKRKRTTSRPKNKTTSPPVTIVTGYFNLGSFSKGSVNNKFTSNTYKNWMKAYKKIRTPVVAYFDDNKMLDMFKKITKHRPNIKSIFVNRTDMWSFQLRGRIAKIYSQPHYAKHLPNTVVPEYSCAMHAKYDLLNMTMNSNYFSTDYFIWLDIGYFRYVQEKEADFGLSVPNEFNKSRIAFSEISALNPRLSLHNIVFGNHVWVAGGGILGQSNVLRTFIEEYVRFVNLFMEQNLMSTDQQILYGMFVSASEKYQPKIQIQAIKSGWFKLGYMCKQNWETQQKHLT